MEIIGKGIYDQRINSHNIIVEMTIEEYYRLSKEILKKNEFQRKRVKSAGNIYSLLKSDLKSGCIIPPIVLALPKSIQEKNLDLLKKEIEEKTDSLVILDGLQRTYTIRDLIEEMTAAGDPDISRVLKNPIRVEVYIGINRLGILYRMLTLNTGQTPMSSRHQIEIIYSDYKDISGSNIKLITEIEGNSPQKLGEYKFRDIIEGFTSFLERDYLTIERTDILDNIKSLEKLSTVDQKNDLFELFLTTYHSFVEKINSIAVNWEYSADINLSSDPFGQNIIKIFNKSQSLTGFGSALGKLIDYESIKSIDSVKEAIPLIDDKDIEIAINQLIIDLDKVRGVAKKIGNDQRLFFHYFYRILFDKQNDSYLKIKGSVDGAYKQYERTTM